MISAKNYTLTQSEQDRINEIRQLEVKGFKSIPELIGMLTDPSWVVRRTVIETLASLDEAAIGPLCDVLLNQRDDETRIAAAADALVASRASVEMRVLQLTRHPNSAVVADAVQILGRRRSHTTVPVLIGLIKHANDNVAVGAIEALGRMGGRMAIEALMDTIQSGNFFRTFPAIDILGRSGDPRVIDPLSILLTNPNYLSEAARALGRSGERAAVKPLLGLLKLPSNAVLRVGASSLDELRERYVEKSGDVEVIDHLIRTQISSLEIRRLVRLLATSDETEAAALCRLLGAIGDVEAAPGLTPLLDAPTPIATCAAVALRKMGKDADELILAAIRQGSSARRKILLPVVSRATSYEEIANCLNDPDPDVRTLACDVLARLGNVNVVSRIFPLLADPHSRVVHAATAAIQTLGSREARDLAIQTASSENPALRRSALRILAYFGHDACLKPMLAGLHDVDPRVREAAIQGLPYLEDPRALAALFDSIRSPIGRVRSLAMRALGQVPKGNERVYSILLKGLSDSDPWVRYYACQSLGKLAYAPAANEISKLMWNGAGQVRVSAVEALSRLDSSEAYQFLKEAVHSDDLEVKRAALVGVGLAHRSEDLPLILAAVTTSDIPTRLVALSALVSFSSSLVLDALTSAASDPEEQVSSTAISFLAARPDQEVTEVLISLLKFESTREKAKSALLVQSKSRISRLLLALEEANDDLALILVSILSKLDRPVSRAALLSAMKSKNVAARKATATFLAAQLVPEMTLALQDAADHDPNLEVRQICSLLLRG